MPDIGRHYAVGMVAVCSLHGCSRPQGAAPVRRWEAFRMQIAFLDDRADDLTPQRKGHLFEHLCRRLLTINGYSDIVLRAKRASLEYDIQARSRLHGRPLVGEAKAHEAAIPGKEASAFFGKLVPIAVANGSADGVFISTSDFTSDGRDYLSSLTADVMSSLRLTLKTLAGTEITDFLAESGDLVAEEILRERVRSGLSLEPHDAWFTVGQNGDMVVLTCGVSAASAPSHFTTFSSRGEPIVLPEQTLRRLMRQMPDLEGLEYAQSGSVPTVSEHARRNLPPVVAGAGWFDYKFPSPPECFVGRDDPLDQLSRIASKVSRNETAIRAVQILSRSGVGKSSLLLKFADIIHMFAHTTVDGRNIRVPPDIRLAIADLIARANRDSNLTLQIPERQEDISEALKRLGEKAKDHQQLVVIQIDQFEALLARPRVFQAVLDLVLASTTWGTPVLWIMARKNDLAATYDESAEVDLHRLNELSRPIRLDDFSTSEGQVLIDRLGIELGEQVSDELKDVTLTFAAGFPWLLKRVGAHIIGMSKQGVSQKELARGGLRAEDLFNEDLAGLQEQDKALLRTMAANMPNAASELAKRLEGEVSVERLTLKLNEFLGLKLLRLSGDVYDTYNDVFKAYVLTDRVPFQTRFVLRVTPGPALSLLSRIADEGPTDVSAFVRKIGGNATATYNKLRELRLLGLLDPKPGRIALSANATAAVESDSLGDFLRRALRSNGLVVKSLDLVANNGIATIGEIAALLQAQLPHLKVSEKTWITYASILVNWIRYAGLVDVEGDTVRLRDTPSDDLLTRREFNLGTFASDTFVPSVRPNKVRELITLLRGGSVPRATARASFGDKWTAATIRDAQSLNLVETADDMLRLTAQGRALAREADITERTIAVHALDKPNVKALLDAASHRSLLKEDQKDVLMRFGSANWTPHTWSWRLGILAAWVVATGQAKGGRAGLRAV
jgi:hypothetical protein